MDDLWTPQSIFRRQQGCRFHHRRGFIICNANMKILVAWFGILHAHSRCGYRSKALYRLLIASGSCSHKTGESGRSKCANLNRRVTWNAGVQCDNLLSICMPFSFMARAWELFRLLWESCHIIYAIQPIGLVRKPCLQTTRFFYRLRPVRTTSPETKNHINVFFDQESENL